MYNIMIMLGAQAFKFDEKGCWLFQKKKSEFLHYNVNYTIGDRGTLGKMHGTEGIKLCGRYLIRYLMVMWDSKFRMVVNCDKDWKR